MTEAIDKELTEEELSSARDVMLDIHVASYLGGIGKAIRFQNPEIDVDAFSELVGKILESAGHNPEQRLLNDDFIYKISDGEDIMVAALASLFILGEPAD